MAKKIRIDEEAQKKLKRRIAATARNQGGRRRYPAALKRAVVTQAEKWRGDGGALSVLAAELDIDTTMLTKWMRKGQPRAAQEQEGGLRRVIVAEERSAQDPGAGPVVVLPGGVRIEGLALEEVISLVKVL